jgi:hypothetical protein
MIISAVIQAIKATWATSFPAATLYLQLAPGNIKPPYAVFRLGTISPNEPTNLGRDWSMTGTFFLFDTSDSAITATAESVVNAFDRTPITGLYSSLVQSVDLDVNYTDQGALWSASIPVEFRWAS